MPPGRPILAMLSVQTPGGLIFGTATRLEGQSIHFELDARMEPGDVVEWRMELPGLEETAMGMMRIVSGRRDLGPMPTWIAALQSVVPDDQEVFEVWRRGVEQGTRAFSHSTRAPTDSWLASTTMVGSTEAERRQAVAAQEERRRRRLERARTLAKNARAWPDPEDLEGGRSVASGAFRASLSHSVSRAPPSRASDAAGPRPAESARSAVAAALRQGLSGAALPRPPGGAPTTHPDPAMHLDRGMASLHFVPGAAWTQAHRPALLAGALQLARADLGEAGASLALFLILPNGATVRAGGTVGPTADGRTRLDVHLDASARRMVELA